MDLTGKPGRTGLGALRSAPAASGAAAPIAPGPAAAATAKRAADALARKEAKAKVRTAKAKVRTAKAQAARAAQKAQAGDTAAAAAGTPVRAAEAVVSRAGVLSDVLDVLGTVVAVAVAGEVVGAVVGAAVAAGVAAVVAGVAVGAAVAARQHRSFVAAERDVRTTNAPSASPVVPDRKRKGDGEDLPPASRGRHPETWARNNYKKHTGLHRRVWHGGQMTAEIDHSAIPHPQCTSGASCLLDCCSCCYCGEPEGAATTRA